MRCLLVVPGQAGLDPGSGAVAGATFELQARQAFENLRAILEDAGSGLHRVVKTTCWCSSPGVCCSRSGRRAAGRHRLTQRAAAAHLGGRHARSAG
jgi:enamine deaminase RidA (YjgF/YER057c/UK114 family)